MSDESKKLGLKDALKKLMGIGSANSANILGPSGDKGQGGADLQDACGEGKVNRDGTPKVCPPPGDEPEPTHGAKEESIETPMEKLGPDMEEAHRSIRQLAKHAIDKMGE